MKIYASHSRSFNFVEEFYLPLKKVLSEKHELILPHADGGSELNSKDRIKHCDLVIAEVTYPSTGMGIELGWADENKIPVIALYKKGKAPSPSIFQITKNTAEYTSQEDLIKALETIEKEHR